MYNVAGLIKNTVEVSAEEWSKQLRDNPSIKIPANTRYKITGLSPNYLSPLGPLAESIKELNGMTTKGKLLNLPLTYLFKQAVEPEDMEFEIVTTDALLTAFHERSYQFTPMADLEITSKRQLYVNIARLVDDMIAGKIQPTLVIPPNHECYITDIDAAKWFKAWSRREPVDMAEILSEIVNKPHLPYRFLSKNDSNLCIGLKDYVTVPDKLAQSSIGQKTFIILKSELPVYLNLFKICTTIEEVIEAERVSHPVPLLVAVKDEELAKIDVPSNDAVLPTSQSENDQNDPPVSYIASISNMASQCALL